MKSFLIACVGLLITAVTFGALAPINAATPFEMAESSHSARTYTFSEIEVSNACSTWVTKINSLVGTYCEFVDGVENGFLWEDGVFTTIDALEAGATNRVAYDINDRKWPRCRSDFHFKISRPWFRPFTNFTASMRVRA